MHIIIDTTTTQDQFAFAGVGQYTKNITLSLLGNYPNTQFSILRFKNKISTLDKDICKYKNVQQVDIGEYQVNGYKNDITYYSQVLPVIKKIKEKTVYTSVRTSGETFHLTYYLQYSLSMT